MYDTMFSPCVKLGSSLCFTLSFRFKSSQRRNTLSPRVRVKPLSINTGCPRVKSSPCVKPSTCSYQAFRYLESRLCFKSSQVQRNRKCTGMDEVDNDHYFRTGKRLPNNSEWWRHYSLTMTVLMLIHP